MNEKLVEHRVVELLHAVTEPIRAVRDARTAVSRYSIDKPHNSPSQHIDPLANLNTYDEYVAQMIETYPETLAPYAAHLLAVQTMDGVPAALRVMDMVLNPDVYKDQHTE